MAEKKTRLFYFEDAINALAPVPPDLEEALLSFLFCEYDDDDVVTLDIRFQRADMTDEEFDAIPEE